MGAAILAASGVQTTTWTLLSLLGALGMLALISPTLFQRVAAGASQWFERLDRRYDIDHLVLPHSRVLGALVVASVVFLSGLLYRHGF